MPSRPRRAPRQAISNMPLVLPGGRTSTRPPLVHRRSGLRNSPRDASAGRGVQVYPAYQQSRAGSNRGVSRPRRGGGASSGAMASFGRFRSWPITAARVLEPQLKEMGLRVPVCVATAAADAYMMLASTRAGRVRARGEWLH